MPVYYVPVRVTAIDADEAEEFVEGLMKGRKPAELPDADFQFVGDAEAQQIDDDDGPRFGEVELTPFRPDGDTGENPEGTVRLDGLENGALFEDEQGNLFNIVSQGPMQGSTEIVDDEETHAYYDCGALVKRHGPAVSS
jgi:hypothetical protein